MSRFWNNGSRGKAQALNVRFLADTPLDLAMLRRYIVAWLQ